MQTFSSQDSRHFPEQTVHTDVLMAGGELAGICAALAAARFSDASGDGVSGFLAWFAHRMGRKPRRCSVKEGARRTVRP